ncbi:MAG: hypothetical protein U1E65_20610 [Myxococcota bacterium]
MRLPILLALGLTLVARTASADEDPPRYRNPQGSLVLGGGIGIAVGDGKTTVAVGLSAGYAVFTGVVPALRGTVIFAEKMGGELAATLTLTPPINFFIVPALHGEVGRRWDGFGQAWLYGGGPAVYLGEADSALGLEVGWVFRRYSYDAGVAVDGSGPLISLSVRL